MAIRQPELERTEDIVAFDRSRRHLAAWIIVETFAMLAIFCVLSWKFSTHFLDDERVWYDTSYFWGFITPVTVMLVVLILYLVSTYTNRKRLVPRQRWLVGKKGDG